MKFFHIKSQNINKGMIIESVYTVSRWEYQVKAIRKTIILSLKKM